jgi:hypothetical protein
MERLTSFSDLIAFLDDAKLPHHADASQQVVEVPTSSGPLKGSVYIRWERQLPYVQVIHPMVLDVPAERLGDVEHAICKANGTVPLPGFGFEYGKRFIYFRLCVPMYDEGMLTGSFQRQVLGVIQNARDFLLAFRDVAAGRPGDEILELAVTHASEATEAQG